ncbi:hypothetical protein Hypma_010842 [Hypsizygus marmoreus]|uniref:Uncharacterized protein n=1 Tax=Hypsizygus marmoreus TaxID=39966 RepID=A0A369JKK8_HYPMA|nr:hypothetical protein Hypma_010842 [Hypsizygus marmoreus]
MNTGPPPHANAEARRRELQNYAGLWYKYTMLFESNAAPMRAQGMEASKVAYDRVVAELATKPARRPIETRPYKEVMQHLKSLADICEMKPKSFEDRYRIGFAAEEYIRVLTQCVIGHPSRPAGDTDRVLQLVDEMLRDSDLEPLPQGLPRLVHLIPDDPTTRPVTPNNIAHWRANPTALIGNGFIEPDDEAPRAFVVVDYAVKRIRGQCYDVQYEDTGPEIFTLGLEEVLEMVADARLVTNM